jgi:acyl phosphate:glycerol-3-phosphate acyltransferase
MPTFLIIAAVSYLLGSIPFGYLLVRIFRGEDVRQSGSGNIGATNVSRKSPALGLLTLFLDAGKGTAAVLLSRVVAVRTGNEARSYELLALAALFAVVGHMFPVWLKFRGGKGVATGLGSFILIAPEAVLIAAVIFLVILLLFRYVSLGSVVAVGIFPLIVWFIQRSRVPPVALGTIGAVSVLIVARHQKNIRRLLTGTERRIGTRRAQP